MSALEKRNHPRLLAGKDGAPAQPVKVEQFPNFKQCDAYGTNFEDGKSYLVTKATNSDGIVHLLHPDRPNHPYPVSASHFELVKN